MYTDKTVYLQLNHDPIVGETTTIDRGVGAFPVCRQAHRGLNCCEPRFIAVPELSAALRRRVGRTLCSDALMARPNSNYGASRTHSEATQSALTRATAPTPHHPNMCYSMKTRCASLHAHALTVSCETITPILRVHP